MATEKTFTVAGISTLKGKTKIRFANDVMRIKILAKNGHENVDLIELPSAMTKPEIVAHLRSVGFGASVPGSDEAYSLILKRNPVAQAAESVAPQAAEAVPA